jgi:hypothetical protein
MIVAFILAMIAGVCIMLRNITDIQPIDTSSSNIDDVETVSTELSTTVETTSITTSSTVTSSLTSTVTSTSYNETEIETSSVSTVITTTEDIIISIINPQIIVIPDETTVKSTKAITSTTTSKTIKIETTACVTTTTQVVIGNEDVRNSANFVKTFTRGTYYCYEKTNVCGGSGRLLMDCSIKDDEIKGSVACRYIYEKYGYNYNGARTIVYLDIPEMSDLSGFYFVDDCCGRYDTIDFYFTYKSNCPFMNQGVLTKISCYIVPNGSVS